MTNKEKEFQPKKKKKSLTKLVKGLTTMSAALAITSGNTQANPDHPHPWEPHCGQLSCPVNPQISKEDEDR